MRQHRTHCGLDSQRAMLFARVLRTALGIKASMTSVSVEVTRFVDDHFPGFVECTLTDAHGQVHTFVEKAPVVSTESLVANSKYPCAGVIACTVEADFTDPLGRKLARINTEHPWNIESSSGETKFVVASTQLVR
jgi:hypothetical protein